MNGLRHPLSCVVAGNDYANEWRPQQTGLWLRLSGHIRRDVQGRIASHDSEKSARYLSRDFGQVGCGGMPEWPCGAIPYQPLISQLFEARGNSRAMNFHH